MKGPCGADICLSEGYENDHTLDYLTSDDSVLEGGKRNDSLVRSVVDLSSKKDHHHSTKE